MQALTDVEMVIKHSVTFTCSVFAVTPKKISDFTTNNQFEMAPHKRHSENN